MNFIKRVLSTVAGIFVFLTISFFCLLLLGLLLSPKSDDLVAVKPNSVLKLTIDYQIKDYVGKTKFSAYSFFNNKKGLFDIIDAIKHASTDDKIKGISIDNNFIKAGISQTKALRDAVLKFKESGKFVVAYADVFNQKDYYLSSVADTIYLNPAGAMEFKGLHSEQLYFKDFQEKSGFKMEVVRLGKYKSAVEPYLANTMSDNNREQVFTYLNSLWSQMKHDISKSRNISVYELNSIADSLLARTPDLAISSHLIDKKAYHDEYIDGMKHAMEVDLKAELNQVKITDYAEHLETQIDKNYNENKIAVIYAQGDIVYGEGDENRIGQGIMSKSLKKARNNDKIKAVVLRINSPGGSALASELIWREIELTKKIKPIIVSMGDLAASGGYYIASNADKIIAEPTTITGSIGVFGVLPNGKELADNIGINAEQVVTNQNAVTYSFFEPLSDTQRKYIKEGVLNIYDLFLTRVSQGRNLTKEAVEKIAQGRVWTGTDALNIGLVDELGGLDLALKYAAEAAEIKEYSIRDFPVYEKDLDKMLEDFGLLKTKETILKEELGEANYKILEDIKWMSQKKGAQLLFPYSTEIK